MHSKEKIRIGMPVIVEGKYDVIKLGSILDAHIIKTDGFGVFKSKELAALIRDAAEKKGVIIFTDSDGAGLVIRNKLRSFLPKNKVINLYPPQVSGKEKRKKTPSKEGFLGVEGIDADVLRDIFLPFASDKSENERCITKTDLFEDGLTGGPNSAAKRMLLKKHLSLPDNISANALLDVMNLLYSYDEYKDFLNTINETQE